MPDDNVAYSLDVARRRAQRWAPIADVANDGLVSLLAMQRLCGEQLDAGEHRALALVIRMLFEASIAPGALALEYAAAVAARGEG